MEGWIDGWMSEWVDGRMNGRMYKWIDEEIDALLKKTLIYLWSQAGILVFVQQRAPRPQ